MPASKAQQKAVSKYMKENYDVFQVRMKKGKKDTLQEHAQLMGESVNGFINRAIDNQITQDRDKGPSEATESTEGVGVVSLPSGDEKAQETALSAATAKEE